MLNQNGVVEGSGSEGLLRVRDAADFLAVSERTIWRMIADGQLTAMRVRRCTRLSLAQVAACIGGFRKVGGI